MNDLAYRWGEIIGMVFELRIAPVCVVKKFLNVKSSSLRALGCSGFGTLLLHHFCVLISRSCNLKNKLVGVRKLVARDGVDE